MLYDVKWTVYSSRRWKTNVQTLKDPIGKVKRLRGVSCQWKADGKQDHRTTGPQDRRSAACPEQSRRVSEGGGVKHEAV